MPRVDPEWRTFGSETDRLLALLRSITSLEIAHRKVIAEIVHLRHSILLENHLKIVFSKLSCGAAYLDGSMPILTARQTSSAAAIAAISLGFAASAADRAAFHDRRFVLKERGCRRWIAHG